MSEVLRVSQVQAVNVVEVVLPDDIDASVFDNLNEGLAGIFQKGVGGRWILDLARVEYMGSAALGLLVNIRHQVRTAQGQLALCNLSPRLEQIFRTCSLERLFTIGKSREDALRAVS